jgi:hypothetical protein
MTCRYIEGLQSLTMPYRSVCSISSCWAAAAPNSPGRRECPYPLLTECHWFRAWGVTCQKAAYRESPVTTKMARLPLTTIIMVRISRARVLE